MPGLIDAHFHALFAALPPSLVKTADTAYINLLATQDAERTLLRGFTAVRDVGGPSFALKRAIDEGLVAGPRIYPSGLPISQTSGHGDLREIYEVPSVTGAPPTRSEQLLALIADSPDEVRRCTREQLMLGASQIKLMAGGGIVSHRDPIDATQYSEAELRAAVEAAADWNTYVTTHVYTPTGIRRSIAAGVRCIEHGHLADEDCARMMADRGVWWSLQPFVAVPGQREFPDDERQSKLDAVLEGTDRAYKLARKFNVRTAFGTDQFFNPAGAARQTDKLVALKRWYSGTEIIRMATHDNAALLALSGPRNPYPHPLGVIEAGAYADMLLVDGDPIDNPELLVDADRNIRLIMKDGRIFKDSLS